MSINEREIALKITCPTCLRVAGQLCVNGPDYELTYPHYERLIDGLKNALNNSQAENEKLNDKVQDYQDDFKHVMSEESAHDEQHCSCVPHLRRELEVKKADCIEAETEMCRQANIVVSVGLALDGLSILEIGEDKWAALAVEKLRLENEELRKDLNIFREYEKLAVHKGDELSDIVEQLRSEVANKEKDYQALWSLLERERIEHREDYERETKLIDVHFQMCREREQLARWIVHVYNGTIENLDDNDPLWLSDLLARNIIAAADDPPGATQECGCIHCVCENIAQCHGCGAKFCAKHAAESKARKE